MEEIKVIELPEKPSIKTSNYLVVEDEDGTKKVRAKHLRSLLVTSLFFNNIEELKNSSAADLKEGDICRTLGYYEPGDGGGGLYKITYNPAARSDEGLVHYLNYSDTLRAELVLEDSVSVHQFGAVGDGVTDDSTAIENAINNAKYKVIEFGNNNRYLVSRPIKISTDGLIINGNSAVIYPVNSNGIDVKKDMGIINDITINKLHVDCSKAYKGINIEQGSKIDLIGCKLFDVTNTGIFVKNSEFVNVHFCELVGKYSGTLISVDGSHSDTGITCSRFINIVDCNFNDFKRGVRLASNGIIGNINALINLDKCNYHTTVAQSYCIEVACPVEMLSIYANTVTKVETFLRFGGLASGDVSCRGISCLETAKVFDIGEDCVLHLDGSVIVSEGTTIFENMDGKLHSTVSWDLLPNGARFNNKPNGEIYDAIHPYNYYIGKGYNKIEKAHTTLTITEARNLHVDWTSDKNLESIANGVKGQLIYLISSTEKSLKQSSSIILSDDIVKLGKYKGIILRYDGTKWLQIQYKDSTFLKTVRDEFEIDYSRIQFDTSEIITP